MGLKITLLCFRHVNERTKGFRHDTSVRDEATGNRSTVNGKFTPGVLELYCTIDMITSKMADVFYRRLSTARRNFIINFHLLCIRSNAYATHGYFIYVFHS